MTGKLLRLLEMPDKVLVSSIQFHFQHSGLALKDRNKLRAFILSIFKKEKTAVNSLSYIFCSDKYLLEINKNFLQHDFYTDIITFNLAGKKMPVEGEIYISIDRVRENANALNQYLDTEFHRVIFHGVLHLCGYRDKTRNETNLMRKKEGYYLKSYLK
jgi:probable rRNA maturation factor